MEIIIFDTTRELYKFLRETGALEKLELFRNTPKELIPPDNVGYVAIDNNGIVLGAATLYEEGINIWFNELFEITPESRGKGIGRLLYEFIKQDLEPEKIHGFCTNDKNKSFWEHLGQVCIDEETSEMLEIINKNRN